MNRRHKKRKSNIVPTSGIAMMATADHTEMFGIKLSASEIAERFQNLSIGFLLPAICRLIATFHMKDGRSNKVIEEILSQYQNEERMKAFIDIINKNMRPDVLFNSRQMLLNTAKFALAYADEGTFDDTPVISDPAPFLLAIYLTSVLSSFLETPLTKTNIMIESVQSGIFNRQQDYYLITQRSVECYLRLSLQKNRFKENEYVDIPALFKNATGIEIKHYLVFLTAIIAGFSPRGQIGEFIWTNEFVRNSQEYIERLGIPVNDGLKLLNSLTISVKEFKQNYLSSLSDRWDFNYFRKKPLIQLRNVFYPLDSQFVLENIWDGLYWKIIDGSNHVDANKFRAFFGRIFETYCQDLLLSVSDRKRGKIILEFPYGRDKRMSPDAFIDYGEDLIVFDFKAKRMKLQATLVKGDLEAYEEDIYQMIVEPARKIHSHLKAFNNQTYDNIPIDFSRVKRMHAVVVTQGSLSGLKLVYEQIEGKLKEQGLYSNVPKIDCVNAGINLTHLRRDNFDPPVRLASNRFRFLVFL